MLDKIFKKDKVWSGILIGFLLPLSLYGITMLGMELKNSAVTNSFYENIQLLLIAINAIVMRHFMINRDQENIGKGVLSMTFIWVLLYVVYYHIVNG